MRFADWYAVYLERREEVSKHGEGAKRDLAIASLQRHRAIAERRYQLAPDIEVELTYQLRAGVVRSAVVDIRRHGHPVSMAHYLTPSDLRAVASILDESDAWEAGFSDEMPPSGPWKH